MDGFLLSLEVHMMAITEQSNRSLFYGLIELTAIDWGSVVSNVFTTHCDVLLHLRVLK